MSAAQADPALMPNAFWRHLIPLASGCLFGIGLVVSGMSDPQRVLGFLDFAGAWNPALAVVMGSALAVTLPAFAYARQKGCTALGEPLSLPERNTITPKLVLGAVLFGVGWGLSGVCPGPSVLLATTGAWQPLLFLLSLLAGARIHEWWSHRTSALASGSMPDG